MSSDLIAIILVWLFPLLSVVPPDDPFITVDQITDAELDGNGNIYVLSATGNIHKYSLQGEHQQSMSFDDLFSATDLDVTIAFRVFIFNPAGQRFLMLDRNLRLLNDHYLDDSYPGNITFAISMPDQNYWLYDETSFSLLKYNPLSEQTIFQVDLTRIIREHPLHITNMENHQNRLYLHAGGENLYVFDINGNLIKSQPLKCDGRISFYQDKVFLTSGDKIISMDLYTGESSPLSLPVREPEKLIKVLPSADRIYLVYDDGIVETQWP